ncbi:prolipoprotein diacylglyceryl transferase [Shimia biformata]|uniref:prolipoprotein diacylglyceryl transferase n=1 Tax=Shimia biformata TaxID=1294299 RepID=UPI00194E26F2|nr:prolipoprotein diacylglyceryl transferase [Shimia biformata]
MLAMIPFPDISPELFSFTVGGFEFALRWYALAYIVGILVAWWIMARTVKRDALWPGDRSPMSAPQVEDFLTWAIIGVILGGRLGSVLFYNPGYYLAHPGEILQVWKGGMSFHGGFLGVVIAAWIFAGRNNIPKLAISDALALSVAPGLFLGRIANFINAELWGRQTDMPWGVVFPGEAAQDCGQLTALCARHPSQLYEALLEGLLLGGLLLWMAWRRGALKKPGLIAGLFFAGYGVARFLVEFVRQPDAQFVSEGNPLGLAVHVGGIGLTMGQLLSLPMIAAGLWLAIRAQKQ